MADQDNVVLSREELLHLIQDTVRETLTKMGMQHESPIEMQKDFKALRDWRMANEELKRKGLVVALSILVTGTMAAIWLGVKAMISQ
jgi:hypothetical protein